MVGDIDLDGILDVVTANATGQTISVLRGNGNRTFMSPAEYTAAAAPSAAALHDVDGDGRLDLVIALYSLNSISVYKGSSGFATHAEYAAGTNPNAVVVVNP